MCTDTSYPRNDRCRAGKLFSRTDYRTDKVILRGRIADKDGTQVYRNIQNSSYKIINFLFA